MAKLAHASESVIRVGIIMLNLDKWLAELLLRLLQQLQGRLDAVIRLSEHDVVDFALLQYLDPSLQRELAGGMPS